MIRRSRHPFTLALCAMVILAPVALANENWPHFRGPTMNAAVPVDQSDQHYYRVQGPTFLIEYDNTQGDGNHIHAFHPSGCRQTW